MEERQQRLRKFFIRVFRNNLEDKNGTELEAGSVTAEWLCVTILSSAKLLLRDVVVEHARRQQRAVQTGTCATTSEERQHRGRIKWLHGRMVYG